MAHPKKHAEEEGEEGPSSERWLLTYADMITLLMVLFIVLFAMGQTDIRKFNAFKDSFHELNQTQNVAPSGGPGVLSQPSAIAILEQNPFAKLNAASASSESSQTTTTQASGTATAPTTTTTPDQPGQTSRPPNWAQAANERADLLKAEADMIKALQKLGLAGDVNFTQDARGLTVSILTDKVLFPLDSAQLQPDGVEIVNAIAPVLAILPNQVDIEGDTDNQPIHGGPYADNWALSAARAVAVVDDLIRNHGVDPNRLQATGNSDTRPIVPNDSSQHRAQNRRVEIVIFSTSDITP